MKSQQKLISDFIILNRLGDELVIPVRYSAKAKRIIIRLNHEIIELVLPNKNFNAGRKFLLEKELWVRRKLQEVKVKYSKLVHIDNSTIPLFDTIYSLQFIDSEHHEVQIKDDIINVYSLIPKHNNTLIRFLQDKLLLEIVALTTALSKKYNLHFTEIKIMNNKGKWGSCSSKAVLFFNWRLIFVPKEILEYVIVHEMCHLVEMNHSKNFWYLVSTIYPNYKIAKLWLKENGYRVHQYLENDPMKQ